MFKFDGFRVEAVRTEDSVRLYSKQGKLMTSQFIQVAQELEHLSLGTALDGELVAVDKNGVPKFNLLQNYRSRSAHLMYFAFDVLAHEGQDVSKLHLWERRELLRSILQRGPHVDLAAWSNDLGAMERFAREHKLEGIVAKTSDSRYEPGKRTGSWVKLRFNSRQEFVTGGYTPGDLRLDALLVRFYLGKDLDLSVLCEPGLLRRCGAKFRASFKTRTSRPAPSSTFRTDGPEPGPRNHTRKMAVCTWLKPVAIADRVRGVDTRRTIATLDLHWA